MSNPFSSAAIRREFPVERIPAIVDSAGRVNRRALKMVFSGNGCPSAKTEIAATAINNGLSAHEGVLLAMLAAYMSDERGHVSPECVERMCKAIQRDAYEKAACLSPNSKWAEDRAARLEGRESRWDTPEFIRAAQRGEDVSTKHYPYRTL